MSAKVRSRRIPHPCQGIVGSINGTDTPLPNGKPITVSPYVLDWRAQDGMQYTASNGHPFASRSKGDRRDLGGNFYTTKSYAIVSKGAKGMSTTVNEQGYLRFRRYSGPVLPVNPNQVGYPPSGELSSAKLNTLGATAVARCKPTNSVADAATALGELYKDGLPALVGHSVWRDKTLTAKNASEEFLNTEFGWLPLVGDMKKFAHAVTHANAVLEQYERDAGKVVRRRYNFPVHLDTQVMDYGPPNQVAYYLPNDSVFESGSRGRVSLKVETFSRQWFAGAFTYALPSGYDSRSTLHKHALLADKLFGIAPTPEVIWNLAPWSWAVDWFSNTGDVISNVSDWQTDGLVMLYGYMMDHSIVKHTYTMDRSGLIGSSVPVSPLVMVTETKQRVGANPFGFGLTWDGLSPLQKAIAAAIGITRL